MKYIDKFLSSLCHRHCWLSRTFYKTQIPSRGLIETVLVMPFGDEKVTQFSGFSPTSVSYSVTLRSDPTVRYTLTSV